MCGRNSFLPFLLATNVRICRFPDVNDTGGSASSSIFHLLGGHDDTGNGGSIGV